VTVFDFSTILQRTERRVRDDLLGAGPKTVDELRSIEGRLRLKYKTQLERKIQRAKERSDGGGGGNANEDETADAAASDDKNLQLKDAMDKASNFAGGLFAKVKSGVTKLNSGSNPATLAGAVGTATVVDLPALNDTPTGAAAAVAPTAATTGDTVSDTSPDGDWAGTDIAAATDGITNFSIGDDDDDDADLLL